MSPVILKCPNCFEENQVEDPDNPGFCTFCGNGLKTNVKIKDDAVEEIVIEDAVAEEGFEMGAVEEETEPSAKEKKALLKKEKLEQKEKAQQEKKEQKEKAQQEKLEQKEKAQKEKLEQQEKAQQEKKEQKEKAQQEKPAKPEKPVKGASKGYTAKATGVGKGQLADSIRFGAAKIDAKMAAGQMTAPTAELYFNRLMSYAPKVGTEGEGDAVVSVSQILGGIAKTAEKATPAPVAEEIPEDIPEKAEEVVAPVAEEKPKKEKTVKEKPVKEKKPKKEKIPKVKAPKIEKAEPAIEEPEEVPVNLPDSVDELFAMAEETFVKGELVTAGLCIAKILDSDAGNAVAWMMKGGIKAKAGAWSEAIGAWKKGLSTGTDKCALLGMWSDMLSDALFNEIKTGKQAVDITFVYKTLKDVGITKVGYVYEQIFDKILSHGYEAEEISEMRPYTQTYNSLIQAAVYSGNDAGKVSARCGKWNDLLTSFRETIDNMPEKPRRFIARRMEKRAVEDLEATIKDGQNVSGIFSEELSGLSDAERAEIVEFWTADPDRRFDLFGLYQETGRKLFMIRESSMYPESEEDVMEYYRKGLAAFKAMGGQQ